MRALKSILKLTSIKTAAYWRFKLITGWFNWIVNNTQPPFAGDILKYGELAKWKQPLEHKPGDKRFAWEFNTFSFTKKLYLKA